MQKFILVTGISSGIGQYIAQQYVSMGNYDVWGVDINESVNAPAIKFFRADLRDENQAEEVFSKIPQIDLAVNCAGVSSARKGLIEFSQLEVTSCWQDNFMPAFNATKHEIKVMKRQRAGKIINIASIAGHIGMKDFLVYGAAKASIINMTKVAAIEQSENNIQINSISPATIDTPMVRKKYNGKLRDYSNIYYTKGCGQVSDIYHIVRMLEENNFITGSDIKVDGGLTELFNI